MSHRLTRRVVLRLAIAAGCSAGLAACGGSAVGQAPTPVPVASSAVSASAPAAGVASATAVTPATGASATSAPATLTMLGWDQQPIQGVRRDAMAPFNQLHTGVTLQMVSVPGGYTGGYGDKLQAMIASGDPPDLFIIPDSALPYYLINSLARNLSPYVDRDHYDLAQFPKVAIDQYGYKGGLYGLPDNVSSIGMFVNTDQFQRAGIAPPPTDLQPTGWDFAAFLTAAQKVTERNGNQTAVFGTQFGTSLEAFMPWVWSNGGDLLTGDRRRPRP